MSVGEGGGGGGGSTHHADGNRARRQKYGRSHFKLLMELERRESDESEDLAQLLLKRSKMSVRQALSAAAQIGGQPDSKGAVG